jgi:hypothetical protein
MNKNKIYLAIIILFALFALFYLYRYIKIQQNIEMFKIEKNEKIEIDIDNIKPKKYILNNRSINYILDDYYEIDLD